MKTRSIAILSIVLLSLLAIPSYNAMPGGIGSSADGGCSCHGGADTATSITVTGLPETFDAGAEYEFNVSVVNDDVARSDGDNGNMGGFRILVSAGEVSAHPDTDMQVMGDGVTHTSASNSVEIGHSFGPPLLTTVSLQSSQFTETLFPVAQDQVAMHGIPKLYQLLEHLQAQSHHPHLRWSS